MTLMLCLTHLVGISNHRLLQKNHLLYLFFILVHHETNGRVTYKMGFELASVVAWKRKSKYLTGSRKIHSYKTSTV